MGAFHPVLDPRARFLGTFSPILGILAKAHGWDCTIAAPGVPREFTGSQAARFGQYTVPVAHALCWEPDLSLYVKTAPVTARPSSVGDGPVTPAREKVNAAIEGAIDATQEARRRERILRQKIQRASELEEIDHRLTVKSRELLAQSRARLAHVDPI